ncbi:MAG TPA: hypothetical protein VGO97_03150 [Solirubrobacterales bacterium]|jgi:capsular polysaccharide biosynthesis protein|nr:hypothetical protein [Solirubrobacterales bacterium]
MIKRFVISSTVAVTIAVIAALVVTMSSDDVYRAEATVAVGSDYKIVTPEFGPQGQAVTNTVSQLLRSNVVVQGAIKRLRLKETPADFRSRLKFHEQPEATVFVVSLDAPSKKEAVAGLTALDASFREQVKRVEDEAALDKAGIRPLFTVQPRLFGAPRALPIRVSPRPARNVGVAMLLGLMMAFFWTAHKTGGEVHRTLRDVKAEGSGPYTRGSEGVT